ncbi:unnamed protein product, partial [Rotaria sp. Silwood1]
MGAGCCGSKNQVRPPPYNRQVYKTKTPPVTRKPEAILTRSTTSSIAHKSETVLAKIKDPPAMRDDLTMQRFLKLAFSTNNPLKLIDGYLNEPLASLEEALQPFNGQIDQLSYYIKEAKTKCHFPSEHNLTRDESAAIYIYTMKWSNKCLYDHLQEAWNSQDRSRMKPWYKYLRLFKSAFDKLPNAKKEIWQGTPFDESIIEKLSSKSPTLYTSMGLCLQSSNEIQNYLEKNGITKIILIGYISANGKLIGAYSANPWNEVLLYP